MAILTDSLKQKKETESMEKKTIRVKTKYEENHLTAKLPMAPKLLVAGSTLSGFWFDAHNLETHGAERLLALVIPPEVDAVDNYAFSGWYGLRHVCFDKKALRLGAGVFSNCICLETAVLAEGMQVIPLETFSGCSGLRQVTIPDTVTEIHMCSFKNCSKLESLMLPPALEVVEDAAFWGCRSLEKVRLPDTLKTLGDDAFGSCTALRKVYLPDSLEAIGSCAFQNCTNLQEIVLPPELRDLPAGVFAGCKSLRRIVLPEHLENISPYAFYGCENLETVEYTGTARFPDAFVGTPYLHRRNPRMAARKLLPMELLNNFAGAVPGAVLCAMGCHWFDIDKDYRFFATDHPGVIEVRTCYPDPAFAEGYANDRMLVTADLKPIPNIQPQLRYSEEAIRGLGKMYHARAALELLHMEED